MKLQFIRYCAATLFALSEPILYADANLNKAAVAELLSLRDCWGVLNFPPKLNSDKRFRRTRTKGSDQVCPPGSKVSGVEIHVWRRSKQIALGDPLVKELASWLRNATWLSDYPQTFSSPFAVVIIPDDTVEDYVWIMSCYDGMVQFQLGHSCNSDCYQVYAESKAAQLTDPILLDKLTKLLKPRSS